MRDVEGVWVADDVAATGDVGSASHEASAILPSPRGGVGVGLFMGGAGVGLV